MQRQRQRGGSRAKTEANEHEVISEPGLDRSKFDKRKEHALNEVALLF